MITIKNSQRKIAIDLDQIKNDAQKILDFLGYSDFDCGIWITTNATIKRYNALYRKKNRPTDILSFPFHPELKPGQKIKVSSDDDKNLGDLIIAAEYVFKDYSNTMNERMSVLLVHGICHLLGYDHQTDQQFAQMQKLEKILLKLLKN